MLLLQHEKADQEIQTSWISSILTCLKCRKLNVSVLQSQGCRLEVAVAPVAVATTIENETDY